MSRVRTILLTSGVALGLASSALANNIYVVNADFSILPVGGLNNSVGPSNGNGTYSVAPIPGWVNSGPSGQFDPTGGGVGGFSVFFVPVPGSDVVGFTNGGPITQTVGATAVAGVTYTLTVEIGEWNAALQSYTPGTASLDVGANDISATGTPPASGEFSLYTATYTAAPGDAGDPITIVLSGPGAGQGDFADVSLTSSVPEPASWAMMLLGLGVAGASLRSRRKPATFAA